jgi:hypothetical protein
MKYIGAMLVAFFLSGTTTPAGYWSGAPNFTPYKGKDGQKVWFYNGVRQESNPYCANVEFDVEDYPKRITEYLESVNCRSGEDVRPVTYTYVSGDEAGVKRFYLSNRGGQLGSLKIDLRKNRLLLEMKIDNSRSYMISWTRTY